MELRRLGGNILFLGSFLVFAATGCRPASTGGADAEEESGAPVTVRLLENPSDVAPFTVTDLDGKSIHRPTFAGKSCS